MKISSVKIKNFRLLSDVELNFEKETTIIVGRNNSGKTSLTEIVKRFLYSDSSLFQLEDFSESCHDIFLNLFTEFSKIHANSDIDEQESKLQLRNKLPEIELSLVVEYNKDAPNFGTLSPFVIDLNENCTKTLIIMRYCLGNGKLDDFLGGDLDVTNPELLLQELKYRIKKFFSVQVLAQDPEDQSNTRNLTIQDVKKLIKVDFISAQRGLDDITIKESKPLAKILESFFDTTSISKDIKDQSISKALTNAVSDVQRDINSNFNKQLDDLLPSLQKFGYPGLGTQKFQIEVMLDVKKLLSNFTSVYYTSGTTHLPESYNGLGTRNLILILLQLARFYKEFINQDNSTNIHLIFIEEPEAHLHPQMQEVFVNQIINVVGELSKHSNMWSPQFIVSTHSSHISNAASFEHIRYFLQNDHKKTIIKDLRKDFSSEKDKEFMHKYMTLTKTDLFFADKAILVEGIAERLMLPKMIEKLTDSKLANSYLTILEISGAFAHKFRPLLDFLELKTLIITDLDSVDNYSKGKACPVYKGCSTSNACIKDWFQDEKELSVIKQKNDDEKTIRNIHIAYQCPEDNMSACGRSFEDAFILANLGLFDINSTEEQDNIEQAAYDRAQKIEKKSDFAIEYAINNPNWIVPKYIRDGLSWLDK